MGIMHGCSLKGCVPVLVLPLGVFAVVHCLAVGFILKYSHLIAKWVMLITGVFPFFYFLNVVYKSDYWFEPTIIILGCYLLIFGLMFTGYIWFNANLKKYLESLHA